MADVEYGRDITRDEGTDSNTFQGSLKTLSIMRTISKCASLSIRISSTLREWPKRTSIDFPRQWQAYQDNESQLGTDTSVDHVAWLDEADCIRLKSQQIFTLEQLAAMSPDQVPFDIGGERVHKKAIADVAAKQKAAEHDTLAASNQEMADVIAKMQAKIEALEKAKPARKPATAGRSKIRAKGSVKPKLNG